MRLGFLAILVFLSSWAKAQKMEVDFSYAYLYAKAWDKNIQTYNFSRPFLENPQPLLQHGLGSSFSYIFQNERKIQHGIALGYNYFGSYANNSNFENKLNLHFLDLGYVLHYENPEKLKNFYVRCQSFSLPNSVMLRVVNNENLLVDETDMKAFGIGAKLALKTGYFFRLTKTFYVGPFVEGAWSPVFFSPNTEAVINQTKRLASKSTTGIFNLKVGVAFQLRDFKN
jgi:hypothetical protein